MYVYVKYVNFTNVQITLNIYVHDTTYIKKLNINYFAY